VIQSKDPTGRRAGFATFGYNISTVVPTEGAANNHQQSMVKQTQKFNEEAQDKEDISARKLGNYLKTGKLNRRQMKAGQINTANEGTLTRIGILRRKLVLCT
jgi:3-mercaptopyruvate sulfurtransferase SseA